jgi:hypothetical protein
MHSMVNTLGECFQCSGDLCTKGDEVVCLSCGIPQPNHPDAVKPVPKPAAAPVAKKPPPGARR